MAVTSRLLIVLVAILAGMPAASSVAEAQAAFPYDREFRLDVKPMRGSKRIPGLEIGANGDATIDLWCNSVQAKLVVAADTITILTAPPPEMSCPPDRARGDEDLLAALNEVTNWRMEGEFLVFTGGKSLRFRLNTN
jgi:heat shock protein HslJ